MRWEKKSIVGDWSGIKMVKETKQPNVQTCYMNLDFKK